VSSTNVVEIVYGSNLLRVPWGYTGSIPDAKVYVSNSGYVWLIPESERNNSIYVPEWTASHSNLAPEKVFRQMNVVKVGRNGWGLMAQLRDGDQLLLSLDENGNGYARFYIRYIPGGIRIIADNGRFVDVNSVIFDIGPSLLKRLGYDAKAMGHVHVRIFLNRGADGKLTAFVRDFGSKYGSAVRSADGRLYILYSGHAEDRVGVLGVPPKRYGIHAFDLDGAVSNFNGRLAKIATSAFQTAVSNDPSAPSLSVLTYGFVEVDARDPVELKILDPTERDLGYPKAFYRSAMIRNMHTGGKGLLLELKHGDRIRLALDQHSVELKVKYGNDGVKLCTNIIRCMKVRVGEEAVIGREELERLGVSRHKLGAIDRDHIVVRVTRDVGGRVVAYVSDAGSRYGTAVYNHDRSSAYVLYTGYENRFVAGLPPKSYGIRTGSEMWVKTNGGVYRFPKAGAPVPQHRLRTAI